MARVWTTGMALAVVASIPAAANAGWTAADEATAVAADAVAAVPVLWGDAPALAVTGAGGTQVVRPGEPDALATSASGGAAVVAWDVDRDGDEDLLLCTAAGVVWLPAEGGALGEAIALSSEACATLAVYDAGGEPGLVTATDVLALWKVREGGVLEGPSRFGTRLDGPATLASDGERFAAAGLGGVQVVERSKFGRSQYTAGAGVGGLALGPRSWAWTVTGDAVVEDVTRRRIAVAGSPGVLASADLDGDGEIELLVGHPDAIGVLAGEHERLIAVQGTPVDIAAADLDGDACPDLAVVYDDGRVDVRSGACGSAVATAPERAIELVLDRPGLTLTASVGRPLEVQLVDPEDAGTRFRIRGGPASLECTDDGKISWTPGPADVGAYTLAVRLWGGAEIVQVMSVRLEVAPSAGAEQTTGQWVPALVLGDARPVVQVAVGQAMTLQLADMAQHATVWSLVGGPPGLRLSEAGRVTYAPRADQVGDWEVDVRMAGADGVERASGFRVQVLAPGVTAAVGGTTPSGVVVIDGGGPDEPAEVAPAPSARSQRFWSVQACMLALGFAAGGSDGRLSWQDTGVRYSVSPAMAGLCEGGKQGGLKWFAGADSAPLYAYLLSSDTIGVHTLVGTVGLGFGGDSVRAGPYISMGILMSGLGARLSWMPWKTKRGNRQGFELRATWILSETTSVQGMLLYGWRLERFR